MKNGKYSSYLNKARKNLAANLDRSPLIHSYGYASAGDRSTLFALFPLIFVPFIQYAGRAPIGVAVAKRLTRWIVAPVTMGSNPIGHPYR